MFSLNNSLDKKKQVIDVLSILNKYKSGTSREYDIFVGHLTDPDIEPALLISCLQGLRECVSILGKEFELLVGVLLKLDWASHPPAVIHEYQSLMLNLVSAHTFYLKACLRALVKQFFPKIPKADKSKADQTESDEKTRLAAERIFINVHTLIKAIVQIVPMVPVSLLPLLSECFPHMNKDVYTQECYVKNVLQVAHYIPGKRQQILELVVDKMTKLDVRSPRSDIQEAEYENEEEEMEQETIFEMDESVEKDTDQSKSEDTCPMTHKEADKLDVLMELMFRYIQSICYKNGEFDWEATKKLYKEFLGVFDRIILPTYASCHIQFIMYFMCNMKQPICEGFLDYLWKKVQDPNTQAIFRQASVAYIASLLARGTFAPVGTVTACLDLMCNWVHRYIDQTSYSSHQADVSHHGPFYSVCQSVFYVFAFRHKEILEMKNGHKYVEGLNFQTIVTCRLNPLRVCLPVVAKTFASITRIHQIAFCDTVIERNNRSVLPVVSSQPADQAKGPLKLTSVNPLDSFFPFDPYLLKRSGKYILPIYREYDGNPTGADMESDKSGDEDDDFLPEAQTSMSTTPSRFSYGKTTDFLEYGTSPGFKHL